MKTKNVGLGFWERPKLALETANQFSRSLKKLRNTEIQKGQNHTLGFGLKPYDCGVLEYREDAGDEGIKTEDNLQ